MTRRVLPIPPIFRKTIIVIDGYIQASSRLFIDATFCVIVPRASPSNKNIAKIAIFALTHLT